MKNKNVLKLTYAGVCLALCLVLPFLTGQIPQIGSKLLPMHIPVLLCGFLCGPVWGLAVGLIAPILRSLLFGMPPLFPTALAMAFELGAYGLLAGLFYKLLTKKTPNLFCIPWWGLLVFAVAPILCSLFFGKPVLYPNAIEQAVFGLLVSLCYKFVTKKTPYLYVALILAMIGGRLVWGLAQTVLMGVAGKSFTLAAFWAGAFANAWPGIILQLVLIPPVVAALKKAKLMLNE